jgi:hypothetical protein
MKTKVVFRKFKAGDILALFPNDYEGNGFHLSYQHVGQHSAADYKAMISASKPAKPEEYADLLAELQSIGYDLKIVQKSKLSFTL